MANSTRIPETEILRANRMNSVYAGGHKVTEVLTSEQWKGQRCFILGGGESLKGFDFSLLRGERVIAVNRAFEFYPDADIWYAMDVALYNNIRSGLFNTNGRDVYQLWKDFKGHKVYLCPINYYKFFDKVHYVRRSNTSEVSYNLEKGIFGGNNSGFGALMLALALGANPIFLLGYDLKIRETTHFHSGYPKQEKEALAKKLTVFRDKFEKFKDKYPKDTRIINLCLDSVYMAPGPVLLSVSTSYPLQSACISRKRLFSSGLGPGISARALPASIMPAVTRAANKTLIFFDHTICLSADFRLAIFKS